MSQRGNNSNIDDTENPPFIDQVNQDAQKKNGILEDGNIQSAVISDNEGMTNKNSNTHHHTRESFAKQLMKADHMNLQNRRSNHKPARPNSLMKNFCFFEKGSKSNHMKAMYDSSLIEWRRFQNSKILDPRKMQAAANGPQQGKPGIFMSFGGMKKINLKDLQKIKKDQVDIDNENEEDQSQQIGNIRMVVRRKSCDCCQCGKFNSKQIQVKDVPFVPFQHKKFYDIKYRIKTILAAPIRPPIRSQTNNGQAQTPSYTVAVQSIQSTPPQTPKVGKVREQEEQQQHNTFSHKNIGCEKEFKKIQFLSKPDVLAFHNPSSSTINSDEKQEREIKWRNIQRKEASILTFSQQKHDENELFVKIQKSSSKRLHRRGKQDLILERQIKEKSRCMRALANVLHKTIGQSSSDCPSTSFTWRDSQQLIQNRQSIQEKNSPYDDSLPALECTKAQALSYSKSKLENKEEKSVKDELALKIQMESLVQFRDRYLKNFGISNSERGSLEKRPQIINKQQLFIQPQQKSIQESNFASSNDYVMEPLLIFSENQPILQSPYLAELKNNESGFDQSTQKRVIYLPHTDVLPPNTNSLISLSGASTTRKIKDLSQVPPSSEMFASSRHKKYFSSSELQSPSSKSQRNLSQKFSCYFKPLPLKINSNNLTSQQVQQSQKPSSQYPASQQPLLPILVSRKRNNSNNQQKQQSGTSDSKCPQKEMDNLLSLNQQQEQKQRLSIRHKQSKSNAQINNINGNTLPQFKQLN